MLSRSFQAVKRYPDLILSGHAHSYQRFTNAVQGPQGRLQVPYIVAGAGGYTKLGTLHQINGADPKVPLSLGNGLIFEQYDQKNFGFLRLEVSRTQIAGTYRSAPYVPGSTPAAKVVDTFLIDLTKHTVTTTGSGSKAKVARKPPKRKKG